MALYKVGDFVAFMTDEGIASHESEGTIVRVRPEPTPQDPQRVLYLVAEFTYGEESKLFELLEHELLSGTFGDEEKEKDEEEEDPEWPTEWHSIR